MIIKEFFLSFHLKTFVKKMWKWKKIGEFYKTTYSIGFEKYN